MPGWLINKKIIDDSRDHSSVITNQNSASFKRFNSTQNYIKLWYIWKSLTRVINL
jgi:hypothetical protein